VAIYDREDNGVAACRPVGVANGMGHPSALEPSSVTEGERVSSEPVMPREVHLQPKRGARARGARTAVDGHAGPEFRRWMVMALGSV
jgi:hypothetical protein